MHIHFDFCLFVYNVRLTRRHLRKAEEEGCGSNKECGGCRHRHISAGSKWAGRSRPTYSSPHPPTTEARHQRQIGRKTERGADIYRLTAVKVLYRSKSQMHRLFGKRGHDYKREQESATTEQTQSSSTMEIWGIFVQTRKCLLALMYNAVVCVHNLSRSLKKPNYTSAG